MMKMRSYLFIILAAVLSAQTTPWIPSNTKTIDLPKSTAPATKADKGRIWVAADGKLHYKDTAGVDIEVGTGGSGDITTLAWTPPGTGGVATTQQEVNQRYISVLDYLNATDRAKALSGTADYDATYAFNAAIARAVAIGGGVIKCKGKFLVNIVVSNSGLIFDGETHTQSEGVAPLNYLAPYNNNLPVLQIGNDTGYVSSSVRNIAFYTPNGLGKKGLVFAGGAYKCSADHIQSKGFTESCIEARNDDVYPCTFINMNGVMAMSNANGVRAINIVDNHVSGTGWTTAVQITNFSSTASHGYQIACDSGSASLVNGYLQCDYSSRGILFKKSGSFYPTLDFSNVDVDSMSNPPLGYGAIGITYDCGVDYKIKTQWGNATPLSGRINSSDKMIMVIAGHTTGSINSGQNTLSVASTSGITPGGHVEIAGAGPAGDPFVATVVSVSGLTVTLNSNASSSVSGADVGYGDIAPMESVARGTNGASFPSISFQASTRNGAKSGLKNVIFGGSGTGTVEPWSTTGIINETDYGKPLFILQPGSDPVTPASITQAGNSVTVTFSGSHYAGIGDIVSVYGCNEPGLNGDHAIISRVSATAVTYNSSVSQTLAGVTGSPLVRIYKLSAWRNGKLELAGGLARGGLAIRADDGVARSVLFHDQAGVSTNLQTANTTSGNIVLTYGTSVTTGRGVSIGSTAATKAGFTGNGVLQLATAAAPGSDGTFCQFYSWSTDNRAYVRDSAGTTTLLSLDKTVTAAGTTGARTINTPVGTVNFAAGATSLVVTNSLVTTSSVILCTVGTNDATMKSVSAVAASGSFTIYANAAATAETRVNFRVIP